MNAQGNVFASRFGRNPDAKKINELRQQHLSPDRRADDPSAPLRVAAREQERDERDRARRDYHD